MKATETGKDKVKKICEVLRKETLEPAERESAELMNRARQEAEAIIHKARKEAEELRADARKEIERKKAVFEASLKQACQQTLEALRQTIMEKLFQQEVGKFVSQSLQEPKVAARLIEAVINAIEKEGIESELSAYIAASVPADEVNRLIAPKVLQRLREKGVLVGTFAGGVEIKLDKENLTLDLSEEALKELVVNYTRKDFRSVLFGKE
jgi:V/A-type H+/Na+-transporting ATPase subunit E